MNRIPSTLSVGDVVTLAAPSRFTSEDQIEAISRLIEAEGFRVAVPKGILNRHGQFGGTDLERAKVIQDAWNQPQRGAILPMRGGYGAARLLPYIDFKSSSSPKWMCGFSDITALHAQLNNIGIASFHSPVGSTLLSAPTEIQQQFFAHLKGEIHFIKSESQPIRTGAAEGELIGGNLSVLYSLHGTPYFPKLSGKLLFFEDIDEMLYHLDRMLLNLKLSGVLNEVAGIVVGQLSDMRDNTKEFGFSTDNPFGQDPAELCKGYLNALNVPVCFGFASGHENQNYTLPFGQHVKMVVNENDTTLTW